MNNNLKTSQPTSAKPGAMRGCMSDLDPNWTYALHYWKDPTPEQYAKGGRGRRIGYGTFTTFERAKEIALARGFDDPFIADCDSVSIVNYTTGKTEWTMEKQ